jgi:WD40 repeat protein
MLLGFFLCRGLMGSLWFGRFGALVVVFGCGVAVAQSSPAACGAPPISAASTQANIFSEQQEEWLGDAMADMLEREYRPARDEAQSAYLQAIVDKLARNLPPTQIKFRVLVVDSSEINGFSMAGGHIYITRKLAAIAQNDDELAAVLGHEMGHIASHQFAFETTRDLKRLLGITSVGDRADVYAKFQKLMDARYADKHPGKSGDSDDDQGEADKVGVYVVAAAGYRPKAFAEFWDRTFFVEGKTGGRLSDFFGMTKPDQKRLRGMLKLAATLSPGCGGTTPVTSAGFQAWHESVVANRAVAGTTHLTTVAEVKLTPPLRMDLDRLRFSPDGKMILAQDEGSVFALTREPYAMQFRFDAENALPAQFSPDSQKIVFGTTGLHTEEWSVADKKMLAAHEPIARQECAEIKLSPDGRTMVCVSFDSDAGHFNLALLDSSTGETVWEKKGFFEPTYFFAFLFMISHGRDSTADFIPSSFSPDGNFLIIGPSDAKLAFDLRTRTPVKMGGDLKSKIDSTYAFLDSNRVAAVNGGDPKNSGIYSFPDGRQLEKQAIALGNMRSVSGALGKEYVLSSDIKDFNMALADLAAGKFILGTKLQAIDAWGGFIVAEDTDGSVFLAKSANGVMSDSQKLTLPISPLGRLRSVAISSDGQYLALSTRARGGIWNLKTGQREFLLRGFSNGVWEGGSLYAEFPKLGKIERHVSVLTVSPHLARDLTYTVDDKTHMEYGRLVEWKDLPKGPSQMIVHQVADSAVKWTRSFDDSGVKYTSSVGGRDLMFSYSVRVNAVKNKLKTDGTLAAQLAAIKNKDLARLIEVVGAETGKTVAQMILELPLNYGGTSGLDRAGDLLYVTGNDNRTMVYSLQTGKQLRQIFGFVVAIDPETQRVCTVNRRDEAVVYDADGKELAHFHSGSPLRFASFRAKATQLVLLTADQSVRTVDVANGDAGTAVAAN